MAYGLLFLYVVLIAPLRVGAKLGWEKGRLFLTVGVMVWGIRKAFSFFLEKKEGHWQGHFPLFPGKRRRKKGRDLLSLPLRLLAVRKKMPVGIRLHAFQARVQLHLPSAAQTAQACGLLSALLSLLFPRGESRVLPAYTGPNSGTLLCILDFRLGTLCLAGLYFLLHRPANNQQEEKTWNIPSQK